MTPSAYRPDIDGLRAVAVLSVLFCHSGLLMPGGYVGVDVFFVISGYLITGLIVKDLDQGKFSLGEFWERRVRRILPALAMVVVAVLIAGWFFLLPIAMKALAASVASVAAMVANVQFWRVTGYFEPSADELPLLHTWSLAVEEQFYIIIPFLLILLYRFRLQRHAFAILSVIAIASFALSIYGVQHFQSATFFLLPTRAWELLAGSLLALYAKRRETSASSALSAIGLAAILVPCFTYTAATRFPGWAAVPPVIGSAILIANGRSTVNRALSVRPLVFIGLISYSLYLWHWPLFAFARYLSIHPLSTAQRVAIVAVSLGLGVLSWLLIETPFRRRVILASRWRLLGSAAVAYVVLLLVGLTIRVNDGFDSRMPAEARNFELTGTRETRFLLHHTADHVPDRLDRFGSDSPSRILVWGDSHAMALLPAVDALAKDHGIGVVAATHPSTPPILDFIFQKPSGLMERSVPFNEAVVSFVESREMDAVVMAGQWHDYHQQSGFPSALQNTIHRLQAAGAHVYFVKDVPRVQTEIPRALARYTWQGWPVSEITLPAQNYDDLNQFYQHLLPELEAMGVTILDPLPFLPRVGDNYLPFTAAGSLYAQGSHLSTLGALTVREMFAPVFDRLENNSKESE